MGDRNPPPPKIEHENMAFFTLDVTSWHALSGLFEKAVELHGRIDHVFANAGKLHALGKTLLVLTHIFRCCSSNDSSGRDSRQQRKTFGTGLPRH